MKVSKGITISLQLLCGLYMGGVLWLSYTFQEHREPEIAQSVTENDDVTEEAPVLNITAAPWLSAPTMPRAISRSQYDLYIQLLKELTTLFSSANVTFFLCDGSLLGSYVMQDMLPWDDDIDLMVRYNDLPKVKKIFRNPKLWETYHLSGYHGTGNEYDLEVLQGIPESSDDSSYYLSDNGGLAVNTSRTRFHKFKFFYKDTARAGNCSWNWPFIDVKYYMENDTHIWNLDVDARTRYVEREKFYPLHLRPFSSLWLPAPKDTRSFLLLQFRHFLCRRSKWNHRTESRQTSRKVRCWKLSHWYPFVWREDLPGGTLEVLKLDGKIIQYVGVPEIYSVFQRPFAL